MTSINQEYRLLKKHGYNLDIILNSTFISCIIILHLIIIFLWLLVYIDGRNNQIFISISSNINPSILEKEYVFNVTHNRYQSFNDRHYKNINSCKILENNYKFECKPLGVLNKIQCLKYGCCWQNESSDNIPKCYYPVPYNGYSVVNITNSKSGSRAFLAREFPSFYPDDIQLLQMDIWYLDSYSFHAKIIDATSSRYEPTYPDIPSGISYDGSELEYTVTPNSNGLKVTRKNGDLIFDSENIGALIFSDQFLQISGRFNGKIYGLGEHQSSLQLNTSWTKFTMFNHDGVPLPRVNLYGSHPFYMVVEPHGKSHGVFFHNSNAMDVLLQPLPAITFRSIGGVFDFYFFLGPTPADVIKQYTKIIGRPFMPPYWSLGFHLSRLGYKNTEHIRSIWNRTRSAKIPFDTQWHDIDYMERRNDFTIDRENYADLPQFISDIHEAGMHYVPIVDPGISGCEPSGTYPPFSDGLNLDAFVKNEDGSIFVAKVWNRKCTVFPDFTSPKTVFYWSQQIKKFHNLIPFDGLWIDMNEPSNFLDGSFKGCPSNKWEHPPYLPDVLGRKLYDKTICMSAKQYAGSHYNLHNLYGFTEAIATNRALKDLGKRPFIISRSTYPGSGRYAGHWSGDVVSTWNAMKKTIPQMLSFSLFGIPMMGADICGFNGNTTARLCQRWSQLGAFYPFSRNHNTDDAIDQDPTAFGKEIEMSTKKALMVRYSLLPYLYTLFFKAHTEGETVARPIFFEFYDDPKTLELDESFLWGPGLLIVPVLKEYAVTLKTYFPWGRWYDWYTRMGIDSNGTEKVVAASSDTIPLFIRGGFIIPTQSPEVTTSLSRQSGLQLLVASDASFSANGTLYWDDGESLDTFKKGEYGIVHFLLTSTNLTSSIQKWGVTDVPTLSCIKILGFVKPIANIFFNNKKIDYTWNKTNLLLTIQVNHPINFPFTVSWKMLGD